LEKVRIYELAKELNTTSKRLMEKLAEINIIVKNHMSFLEENEIKALYDHIGVIQHNDDKKAENEAKKAVTTPQAATVSKKDTKNVPRIIRKTEIIIDTKNDGKNATGYPKKDSFADKGKKNRREFVKVADANSGLRAGFVRDTGLNFKKDLLKSYAKTVEKKAADEPVKEDRKPGQEHEKSKADVMPVKEEVKHAVEPERIHENKQEIKQETKQRESKQEIKQDEGKEVRIPVQSAEHNLSQQAEVETSSKPGHHTDDVKVHKDKGEMPKVQDVKESVEISAKSEEAVKSPAVEAKKPEDKKEEKPQDAEPEKSDTTKVTGPEVEKADKQRVDLQEDNKYQSGKETDAVRAKGKKEQNAANVHTETTVKEKRDFRSDRKASAGSHVAAKQLDIDITGLSTHKKEEVVSPRGASRREIQSKEDRDLDREIKREQRKDIKGQAGGKAKKLKPHVFSLHEKKDISEILSDDFDFVEDFYTEDNVKRAKKQPKQKKESKEAEKIVETKEAKQVPQKAVLTSIKIPDTITVKELAEALKKTSSEVIKKLMSLGLMVGINQEIDFDTASIVADEFGVKAEKEIVVSEEDILFDDSEDKEEDLVPRPPVVVVMGHVDHGKTSLLDAIRESHVTESEAGGITQHIGAYTVKINNRNITFLDTPGHEAFTALRARGAQVTDIAILVVAADDGVMPQTVEAINHAKAAKVTIIVAINKIDKPGANPERVKQQLTEYGLIPEEWGGDTICVPVSAKKRENIDTLLEMVLLTADIMELKANPNKQAKGTVIEAKLDKNRGPVATLLVQRGVLKTGDSIISGATFGRIRAMTDDKGKAIKKAGPSTPVEIIGLPEVPEAGETFYVVEDEKLAKQLVEKRKQKQREQHLRTTAKVSLDDLFNQIKEGKVKELNIIVKADAQGSVEALKQSLEKLSNDEVKVKIIHGAVGAVTESDITLAQVSNAIIIGFNVRPAPNVADAAKDAGVDMRLYRVIYNAIEDIEAAMKGMLEPTFREVILGHTEVRQIFKISGVGTIGGCYVLDGKITRNSEVRVVRDGIVIHEGRLASLKRFKDDVKEVVQGYECGLSIEKFNDIKEGDIVESFIMEEVAR